MGILYDAFLGQHVREGPIPTRHEITDVINVPLVFITRCAKHIPANIARVGNSPYYPLPLTCNTCIHFKEE